MKLSANRWLSPIWLIPILAIALSLWMVWQESRGAGPQIEVLIDDAEGLEPGKTPVKVRNVDVGLISAISLSDDLSSAVLTIDMNKGAQRMLAEDTQFWVVKPRVGKRGVSGLSTLLSGAYVQLRPGDAEQQASQFVALSEPPITSQDSEGTRYRLVSDVGPTVNVGDSIVYRGVSAGQVESVDFSVDERKMHYDIFIKSPYDQLLTDNTRFWLQSGLSLNWSSSGLDVSVGSLEALLGGGINFGVPEGQPQGKATQANHQFRLFANQEQAQQEAFARGIDYVILLEESVAGLAPGAPMQFKGVRVGTVMSVPLRWSPSNHDKAPLKQIPVLVRYEPERLEGLVANTEVEHWRQQLPKMFEMGLRANIRASNLLTNTLYVDLRFYGEEEAGDNPQRQEFAGYPVMPSAVSDFNRLEEKLTALLDKFNGLKLEQSVERFTQAMNSTKTSAQKVEDLANSVAEVVAQPGFQQTPALLQQNLEQLNQLLKSVGEDSPTRRQLHRTLANVEQLSEDLTPLIRQLKEQPNALIFDAETVKDPEPKAHD